MTRRFRAVPVAVGVSALILLGTAAVLRHGSPERPPPHGPAFLPGRGGAGPAVESRPDIPYGSAGRGTVCSGIPSAADLEIERIYRQYRVALSTHDRAAEDELYPALLARREAALAAALRDAAGAASPEEREWAERSVRFLSDPPVPPQYRRPRRNP